MLAPSRTMRSRSYLRRLKKNSPRLTHIFLRFNRVDENHGWSLKENSSPTRMCFFCDLIDELDDYHTYLKKIYTSYVFLLKARVEDRIITTDIPIIKKLVVVGDIFS